MAEIGFKREKNEKERDLVAISELKLQGYSTYEIARLLPEKTGSSYALTPNGIGKDLKLIRKRWKEEQSKNMDKFITEQRASYRLIRKELYKRLEEATENRKTTNTQKKETETSSEKGVYNTISNSEYITEHDMMREVKILEAIQKNINDECNLVGDAIKLHLEMERQIIAEQISERYSSVGRVEMIPVESVDYEEIKNVVKQLPKGDE